MTNLLKIYDFYSLFDARSGAILKISRMDYQGKQILTKDG